jgi:putative FmdB family regulatory protein
VPTYQYACTECGHQLEAVQSFSDEPLTVCPACEGRLRKVFTGVGIVFKGSGFYRNDSRNAAKADSSTSSETSGDKSSTEKSTSKSDSKSESSSSAPAKTESKPSSSSSSSTAPAAA